MNLVFMFAVHMYDMCITFLTELMKRLLLLTLLLKIGIFLGCKKSTMESAGNTPENVRNVTVQTISDGAVISFDRPEASEAVAVVAKYVDDDGLIRTFTFDLAGTTNSFALNDKISIKMGARAVEVYTVNTSGQRSEGITVQVEPLPPASMLYLASVLESVEFESTPTGVAFSFLNPDGNELIFEISRDNGNGDLTLYNRLTTSATAEAIYMDRVEGTTFRLKVSNAEDADSFSERDFAVGAPFEAEEILLAKNAWSVKSLPTDNWQGTEPTAPIQNLWDNHRAAVNADYFQSLSAPYPQHFTIDLGANQDLKLTRIKVNQLALADVYTYDQYAPKEFEVWGSNNPASDGGWEGWTKIRTCHSFKPSNSPFGTVTEEDFWYAESGEDFGLNLAGEVYRYIRFRTLATWGEPHPSYSYVRIREITLWGVR